MRFALILAGAVLCLLSFTGPSFAADPAPVAGSSSAAEPIRGTWLTESGNLQIEVAPCDKALCGTVVKVLANRSMERMGEEAKPVDARDPMGMVILKDFTSSGDGEWEGQIYNRENGKTYSCVLSIVDGDQLKVRAYRGLRIFGKTQIWKRVNVTADAK
jgi:uncharacterized protein (DUF2147 family)